MLLTEFFAKLGLDLDAASFARGQLAVEGIKVGLHAFLQIAEKVGHELVEVITHTAHVGDEFYKASQKLGVNVEALQELAYAARLADVDMGTLSTGIALLSSNMYAAANGGDEQAAMFKRLGVNVKSANGHLKAGDEVLGDIAEQFSKMEDGAEKTALAKKIFGRGGRELIPLLNAGAAGLAKLRQEARDLGIVLDEETTKQSEEFNDTWTRIKASWEGIKMQVGASLIKPIVELGKKFLHWLKLNREIIKLRLAQVIHGIGVAFSFAWKMLSSVLDIVSRLYNLVRFLVKAIIDAGPIMIAVAAAVGVAWLAATAPVVLMAALFALLLAVLQDIYVWITGGDSLLGKLWEKWKGFLADWMQPKGDDPWWLAALKVALRFVDFLIQKVKWLFRKVEKFTNIFDSGLWDDAAAFWMTGNSSGKGSNFRDQHMSRAEAYDGAAPAAKRTRAEILGLQGPAGAPASGTKVLAPNVNASITIHGATDPHEVKRAVKEALVDSYREAEVGVSQ